MAGTMLYMRSAYVASAMLNSGGKLLAVDLEDPERAPAVIAAHGKMGTDVVIIDYAEASADFTTALAAVGGYAVDCDHGGNHCGTPSDLRALQWQFLKDHPFGARPSSYANALPASYPATCRLMSGTP